MATVMPRCGASQHATRNRRRLIHRTLSGYRDNVASMTGAEDLPKDWWTTAEVARYLDIQPSTVRRYVSKKFMPPPDRRMGDRAPVWRPRTIIKWHAGRARKGAQ